MNIGQRKQSQFELFPGTSENAPERGKTVRLTKDLTLSLENIIVLCIIFVMIVVLFFSFGVEKGKKVAALSNNTKNANFAQAVQNVAETDSEQDAVQGQQEERVVFPVDILPDGAEKNEPAFRPPIDKRDEQENLFTIQVASFKLKKNAQREAERLKSKGHADTFVVPKGSYSIVCVGKFAQRKEAKKFSNRLRNHYNDCLVRRL